MVTSPTALRTLGVAVTPEALDAALSAAEKESLSHLEFLHRLLAGPAEARLQRALERRIRDAKFRELTTLEGFDWAFNADFRGRENNQAFGGQASPFSGDFFIPVPRSLIVFPAQHDAVGFVSASAEF